MNSHRPKNILTYWPLVLILIYLIGATFFLGYLSGNFLVTNLMPYFMGLFFVTFSFFKLLNLNGFAKSYKHYDIPTQWFPAWGYIYPFIELILGALYLIQWNLFWVHLATIIVLGISILGVINSVIKKKDIQCACLGTFFDLPMSTVTIIEDGVMILMAIIMIAF